MVSRNSSKSLGTTLVQDVNEFRKAMEFVALHEWGNRPDGGYTNDPDDPGGETKWGISKRAYPNEDIKNLTPERALQIYASDYWDKAGCDDIPFPLNVVVFDSAVNCGVGVARWWLKDALTVDDYLEMRKGYYLGIVDRKPSQGKYLKGWLNRIGDLKKFVEINFSVS